MNPNQQSWQDWVDRTEERRDLVTPAPLAGLAALLDIDDYNPVSGFDAPLLSHWLYFAPVARQSEIGEDGHPRRGGFLPPITLPRRMWAGGRLQFHKPIRVDDEIRRVSRIQSVAEKSGRSGDLAFVTVRHEISGSEGVAITEEQDIVYREAPRANGSVATSQAPRVCDDETFSRSIVPDPVLLFRYSAVTFNGHRIHYDRRYVTEVEGYPGLVVHGPLIATLLLELVRGSIPEAKVSGFAFRAVKPLFDVAPFQVCGRRVDDGKTVQLWAKDADGALAMDATATLA